MLKKFFGIVLIILSVLAFLLFLELRGFFELVFSIFTLLSGIRLFRSTNKVTQQGTKVTTSTVASHEVAPAIDEINVDNIDFLTFSLAGVTKENDSKENIQALLRTLVTNELEYVKPYEGYTNKEILEEFYYDRIYEVNVFGSNDIEIVPEPDNIYDSNALKVIHDDLGHIGYVPKDFNEQVLNIINNNAYSISWDLHGGNFKYVDEDEEKVKIEQHNYGIQIKIRYEK